MATKTKLEISSFIRGLITEAGPLTFPDNAALVDENNVLNKDGSRQRRLGLNYESPYTLRSEGMDVGGGYLPEVSTHLWKNPTKTGAYDIVVVQTSNRLYFYKADKTSISNNILNGGAPSLLPADYDTEVKISTASLLGDLLVTCGKEYVRLYSYNSTTQLVSFEDVRLKIRDLFGIETPYAPEVQPTPVTLPLTPANTDLIHHVYNLRNQGWPSLIPRCVTQDGSGVPTPADPIVLDTGAIPGPNHTLASDTLVWWRYKMAAASDIKNVGVFSLYEVYKDSSYSGSGVADRTPFTSSAPKGAAIIDVFKRSDSRQTFQNSLFGANPLLLLRTDTSTGGVTQVASFAGRYFYAVKENTLTGGDKSSPRLNGRILYSQVIKGSSDTGKCYTTGDPTSEYDYETVATDGGFIVLPEAGEILKLVPLGSSLFVFAKNGVWEIFGGDEGFSALSQNVVKTSTLGALSATSVVAAESVLAYWTVGGIHLISIDPSSGRGISVNITTNTIQTLYNNISDLEKPKAIGIFDEVNRKLRWLYNESPGASSSPLFSRELVFDADLKAFYINKIAQIPNTQNGIVGVVAIPDLRYMMATKPDTSLDFQYSFGWYRDTTFYDFGLYDSPAVLLTGYLTGNAASLSKQVKALVTQLKRTETGFADVGGNIVFTNPSSCIVTPQWEWTNSTAAGKWGAPIQMYRLQRPYYPTGASDPFDYGYTVITSKSGIRGRGRALSLKFESEPGKDMRILGWGLEVVVEDNF